MSDRIIRLCMLLSMLAVAGGCAKNDVTPVELEEQAFAEYRAEIGIVIDDPQRQAAALALLDELIADLHKLRDVAAKRVQHTRELNADYDSTREQFETFLAGITAEIALSREQASDRYRELMAISTPEELAALEKVSSKAMQATVKSIQAI
jgi:hypothetical protein